MYTQTVGFTATDEIWILVANRCGARILASDGGVKNLRVVQEISHPEGRLKNREIDSDREGASMAEGSADYPMHGLVNKGGATFHVMQQFARELARLLHKGRSEGAYSRLVLVAEPRMLGELRASLNGPTQGRVARVIEKQWYHLELPKLRERLAENWIPG